MILCLAPWRQRLIKESLAFDLIQHFDQQKSTFWSCILLQRCKVTTSQAWIELTLLIWKASLFGRIGKLVITKSILAGTERHQSCGTITFSSQQYSSPFNHNSGVPIYRGSRLPLNRWIRIFYRKRHNFHPGCALLTESLFDRCISTTNPGTSLDEPWNGCCHWSLLG